MSNILEAKDPRGIKIYCTKSQWVQHIVSSTGHPIMEDNLDAILETICHPDYIYESHDSEPPLDGRDVYIKEIKSASYHSFTPYTKVVAVVGGGSGEVVTAFNAKSITGGTQGEAKYCATNED